ncbi:glycosyltransferase family 8 protein [Vibrio lentus]
MINVCFCLDSKFLKPLEISVFSILKNTKFNISFHIIKVDSFSEENLIDLVSSFGGNIHFYEMDINLPSKGRFSKAMYGRLYMDRLLPEEVDKVIYLDCDIVVNKCISSLWNANIGNRILGAVPEIRSMIKSSLMRRFNLSDYFNSGVLLVNLNKIRLSNKFQDVIKLIESESIDFDYPDQDALNIVINDDWHKLDPVFNYMESKISYDAVIVHYALSKPWDFGFNENSHFYNEYFRVYPYTLPYFKNDHKKESLYDILKRHVTHPIRAIYWYLIK